MSHCVIPPTEDNAGKSERWRYSLLSVAMMILMALSGCVQEDDYIIPPRFVFESEYVNLAWGYQHEGFYIDTDGGYYTYEYQHGDAQWPYSGRTLFTRAELLEKYRHQNRLVTVLPRARVAEMARLIPLAINSPCSDTLGQFVDSGDYYVYCYAYDDMTHLYRRYALSRDGDFTFTRTSESARVLLEFLRSPN